MTPVSRQSVVSAPSARACGCVDHRLSGPLDDPERRGATGADTGALNARVLGANARKRRVRALAGLELAGAFSQRHVNAQRAARHHGMVR